MPATNKLVGGAIVIGGLLAVCYGFKKFKG